MDTQTLLTCAGAVTGACVALLWTLSRRVQRVEAGRADREAQFLAAALDDLTYRPADTASDQRPGADPR